MEFNFKALPFYIKFTLKLLMILLIGFFITYGHNVFVPLVFAILLSILLLPFTNFLEHKVGFSKVLSNLTAVIFSLLLIASLIYFFSQQIASFLVDIPSIRDHLQMHYETLQRWIQQRFHISATQQTVMLNQVNVERSGTAVIGETFFTITNTLFYIIMVAIYSFLILFYRNLIRRFITDIFQEDKSADVNEVLLQSKDIVQKYMAGLVIEMGIIAILNTAALLIIGVKYAIFLGILTAILNIIPYIGIISGIIFTCLITLTTSTELSDIIWIIVSFEVIHFFDANILMPRIVGSKVKINALVTILGVVIGGTLLGLPGIFLALPAIAILKIIFDRIEDLKPWGRLMGDETIKKKNKIVGRLEKLKLPKRKKPAM